MSAEHTDLRLRTLYRCDANDCHHKYGIAYYWPGQDLKESDFSWEAQQEKAQRDATQICEAYHRDGWSVWHDSTGAARHYCSQHTPPERTTLTEQVHLEGHQQ